MPEYLQQHRYHGIQIGLKATQATKNTFESTPVTLTQSSLYSDDAVVLMGGWWLWFIAPLYLPFH